MADKFAMLAQRLLVRHEGRKAKMYKCPAGKWTVGIGHNIEDRGISEAAIDFIFQEDLRLACRDAAIWLGDPVWLAMDDVRKAVVADFSFNVGLSTMNKFVRLRAALIGKDYAAAAASMRQSKWYGQVGDRGPRLVTAMVSGTFPQDVA